MANLRAHFAGHRSEPRATDMTLLRIILLFFVSGVACAQGWRPDKPVEIITSSAAGGSNARRAVMQRILQDRQLTPVPSSSPTSRAATRRSRSHISASFGQSALPAARQPGAFRQSHRGCYAALPELTLISILLNEHIVFSVARRFAH